MPGVCEVVVSLTQSGWAAASRDTPDDRALDSAGLRGLRGVVANRLRLELCCKESGQGVGSRLGSVLW